MRIMKKERFSSPLLPTITLVGFFFSLLPSPSYSQQNTILIRGEPLASSEINTLPPVCKLIVVEQPGIHHGAGDRPLTKYAPLFEQQQYQLAKNNSHIHHYCWALVSKQRYFRARSKVRRDYYFREFIGDINYVIKNSDKSWPYFDIMLVEQGQMLMIRGEYVATIQKANEALRYKSDSENAFLLKFDAYKAMGKKVLAIEAAKEGLEINPDADRLRKRLMGEGVDVPPKLQPKPEKSIADSILPAPEISDQEEHGKSNTLTKPTHVEPRAEPETDSTKEPPSSNPYCRFCP